MSLQVHTDLPHVPARGLQVVVSEHGASTTIALRGEWALAEQESTQHALARALARSPERLVLDLTHVSFIDSTGVHGTIELTKRAASLDIELVILPGPRDVHRVFELCQLTEWLPFVDKPGSEPRHPAATRPRAAGSGGSLLPASDRAGRRDQDQERADSGPGHPS